MNAAIVQSERLVVARVGMPLGNGKASVLDEQAQPTKYMMTQEDEGPSLVS